MINVPTFTILSPYETYLGKIDNSIKGSVQIFNESFNTFLTGAAYTLSFKILKVAEDAALLKEGNKLAFVYKGKDYLITIVRVEEDQTSKTILGWADSLEQTKEVVSPYTATKAMTFTEYLDVFDHEKTITLGINEVANKTLKLEWEGDDKRLGRILSLATKFDAEAEFEVVLNDDYTTYQWVLNVYKKYESGVSQGIGENRQDVKLRTGVNVKTLKRVVDTTELYTAIRPFGNNDITISSIEYEEYDSEGKLLYYTEKGNRNILAPQARDKFPSNMLSKDSDRYQALPWSYSTDSVEMLFGQALARLKEISQPNVEYTIEGFFDLNLGDTVVIEDRSYKPELILTARVSEQEICWTNPANSKTTFSNFVEEESEIADNLLNRVEEIIAANKLYTGSIQSTNGIVFKNNSGTTDLTAIVRDSSTDLSSNFTFEWFKDGESIATTQTITVTATDINQKAVYGFEAKNSEGVVKASYEVTVSDVSDGEAGKDGVGVAETKVAYQASTSGTTVPTGTWVTTPPTVSAGQYLWTRTTFIYTDESTTLAYSISRMGADGEGVGIADVTITYQAGTSGTTPPTGEWTSSIPSVAANQFLWTRTITTYTDGETSTAYSVGKMGANGTDAQLLYLSASANVMKFDGDDIVVPSQSITITAKLQNANGTATWTAIPYIGSAAQTPITLAGTGNTRTLASGNWTNAAWTSVAITATLGNLTDTLSIVKVSDGAKTYLHRAWKMPDGTFTKEYPADNLLTNSQFKTDLSGWGVGDGVVATHSPEYVTLKKGAVTSARGFFNQNINVDELSPNSEYSTSIEIYVESASGANVGNSQVFLRTNDGTNSRDTPAVNIDLTKIGQWQTLSATGTILNSTITASSFTVAISQDVIATIRVRKPKLSKGTSALPYTPKPSEDFDNAYPKWEGSYSDNLETSSDKPEDYDPWKVIRGEDGANGTDGENGKDAQEVFSGYLTNESIVLPANAAGTVTDFSKANGTFITFLGQTQLNSGVVYSLESATGITTTINATSGAYSVTAISADMGVAIYKATYNDVTIRKQLMVVKARQGATGSNGVGVTDTTITYQAGTSGTTAPTGTWTATIPSVSASQYLWTRTVWTFSNGTSKTGYSVGKMGENGAKGDTGNGIASAAITYANSASGTTIPTSGWVNTIPSVPAGNFLWTRTIFTYTNGNSNTSYAVAKQGEQGNPTGIVTQNTVPAAADRYVGMLWKNTGASGYINGATYRWNGSAFELYIFVAENISVSNLAAISANLGTITAGTINGITINGSTFVNTFLYTEGGVTYTGTTTIYGGNVIISRTGSDGSTWTTKVDRSLGFEDSYRATANAPYRTTRLGRGQLYMVESGVGGYLPARALNTTSWTNLPLASGWATAENNPCQYRIFFQLDGSKLIIFRGQFTTTSGTMAAGNHRPFGVNSFPTEIQPNRTEFSWGLTNTRNGGRLSVTTAGDFQFQVDFSCTYCAISQLSYIIE